MDELTTIGTTQLATIDTSRIDENPAVVYLASLSPLTMVKFVRVPTHRYLLAGVAQLDSELTRFSSRFTD